jgi:hypothetical protein
MGNVGNPFTVQELGEVQAAARTLGLEVDTLEIRRATPNDDAVPESEFWTMAPEGVSVHVGRVLLVDTRKFSDPPHPDDATALLAAS